MMTAYRVARWLHLNPIADFFARRMVRKRLWGRW